MQYIRCAQSDYGCYNVTEPPIDAPRDPLYKSEKEVLKVRVDSEFWCLFSLLLKFLEKVNNVKHE